MNSPLSQGERLLNDFSSPLSIPKATDDEEDSDAQHESHDHSEDDQPHLYRRLCRRGKRGLEAHELQCGVGEQEGTIDAAS